MTCFAHSGGTDANGGHYDSSTGEYHYHHGYPAHQHPDGMCPYSYDDKTDHSSGQSYNDDSIKSNKNYSNSDSIKNNFKDSERTTNVQNNKKTVSEENKDESLTCFTLLLIIIAIVYSLLYVYIEDKFEDNLKALKLLRNIVTPLAIVVSLIISGILYRAYPDIYLILSGKEIIYAWLLWLFIAVILCIVEFVLFTYGIYVILKDRAPITVEDVRKHRADSIEKRFATLKLFEYFLLPVSIIISIGLAILFYWAYPDIVIFISGQEIIAAWRLWVYKILILGIIELLLFFKSKLLFSRKITFKLCGEWQIHMKKIVLKILLGLDAAVIIVLTIYAQFIVHVNSELGIITDGFGREISKAPAILRFTLFIDEWAGISWLIVDAIIYIVLFAIASFLFTKITEKNK